MAEFPSTNMFFDCHTSRGDIGAKLKKVRVWSNPGRLTITCRRCGAVVEKRDFRDHLKKKHPKPKVEVKHA